MTFRHELHIIHHVSFYNPRRKPRVHYVAFRRSPRTTWGNVCRLLLISSSWIVSSAIRSLFRAVAFSISRLFRLFLNLIKGVFILTEKVDVFIEDYEITCVTLIKINTGFPYFLLFIYLPKR